MDHEVAGAHLTAWLRESMANIQRQRALVDRLEPGSEQHKRAVELLLLLQDSLHALTEARELLDKVRKT
jgi:hypothetical protein